MTDTTASLDSLLDGQPSPQISATPEPAPQMDEMGAKPEDTAPPADVAPPAAA